MDHERSRDQENRSGKLRSHEPRRAARGFLLLEALLMLPAAAAAIAIGLPQPLPVAPEHDHAFAVVSTDSDPAAEDDQTLESIAEQDGPMITDDLRAHAAKYARFELPAAIGS